MAIDRAKFTNDLRRFYDFSNKVVLYVGAGGGQLLDPSVETRKRILVDRDFVSLQKSSLSAIAHAAQGAVEIGASSFDQVNVPADVVYFEFCLHEMADPANALAHARSLAPDIIVFEHSADSDWSYYAAEETGVRRAAEALQRFGMRRQQTYCMEQLFRDFDELLAKLAPQGNMAIERAQRFAGATNIAIPMRYHLAEL